MSKHVFLLIILLTFSVSVLGRPNQRDTKTSPTYGRSTALTARHELLQGPHALKRDKLVRHNTDIQNIRFEEYPVMLAGSTLDLICSASTYFESVPQIITPDISVMRFQYMTACRNYSVPLLQANKLWKNTHFNKKRKVVILATGWTNTVNNSLVLAMLSKAFLCRKDVNFIIVDAGSYVDTVYNWAALNTEEIGRHIGLGLTQLVKLVALKNIYLIGHSLGAHIMGQAGRSFTKLTGKKIPRITGLDPAKPCFRRTDNLKGLRRGDAALVDVIHTNNGILGIREPLGDIDFYPGGPQTRPPGCLTIGCAHMRAVEYLAESVYPGNAQNMIGRKCDSWQALTLRGSCSGRTTSPMGYVVNGKAVKKKNRGIFYVDVSEKSPFGKKAKKSGANWKRATCNICKS